MLGPDVSGRRASVPVQMSARGVFRVRRQVWPLLGRTAESLRARIHALNWLLGRQLRLVLQRRAVRDRPSTSTTSAASTAIDDSFTRAGATASGGTDWFEDAYGLQQRHGPEISLAPCRSGGNWRLHRAGSTDRPHGGPPCPRYSGGKLITQAGGTGTEWLVAPRLLHTNHHVINARDTGEPPASDVDFRW
jgi:hypothetical protein